ncbi:MAG: NTP transferase domain-containing protein, partial [Bacteroidaceae bacterium]|nr:NTP transferase domain-containing protein [Bacteroidaceae bacterium]
MNSHNHLVIMAGGKGSRFWPLSSEECPKQFLDVTGCGHTMIQNTLARFEGIVPKENVWVVTLAQYAALVHEQLPEVPEQNLLFEPCGRNTAPCICYASWKIKHRDPRANVVVTPSDHHVEDVAAFRTAITEALEYAAETDAMATLGLRATRPGT